MRKIEKYQFMHHFLPHEKYKKRAKMLSTNYLLFYTVTLLLLVVSFRVLPKYFPGILGYASSISTSELLEYTNQKRAEAGLSFLSINSELSAAAQQKANDMFRENYWAHTSPSGVEPWKWILDSGYDYLYAGENLAKNFETSQEVVSAWYNSPSHRANLLNGKYDEVGFAVVNGVLDGYETTLVVQMFGKEQTQIAQAPIQQALEESPIVTQEEVVPEVPVSVPIEEEAPVVLVGGAQIRPAVNLTAVTKYVGLSFVLFVVTLLSLDIWYSYMKGIRKVGGRTLAHLALFLFLLVSVWLTLSPGTVL